MGSGITRLLSSNQGSDLLLFIFIILVFILNFRLVRKLVFLYFNVNVYLKEIPCLNKVTLPYLTLHGPKISYHNILTHNKVCVHRISWPRYIPYSCFRLAAVPVIYEVLVVCENMVSYS